MNVITPGHEYVLDVESTRDSSDFHTGITLQFLHCEPGTENDTRPKRGKFSVVTPGTTNEEVLRVLIDRMAFLEEKLSCSQNIDAILHLEEALQCLESRTKDRKDRGVESSNAI